MCYLEYIEQIDKGNLANNLYISDISTFVYKTVLGERMNTLVNSEQETPIDVRGLTDETTTTQVIVPNNNALSYDDNSSPDNPRIRVSRTGVLANTKMVIDLLVKNWNVLISWSIADIHLVNYTKLFYNIKNAHHFRDYLEIIQQKWKMDDDLYFTFLNEFYKELYRLKKKNTVPFIGEKQLVFMALYDSIERPTVDNMHSIVKMLL